MELYTLTKGWRVAFGHFNLAEIEQMRHEGWRIESKVYLQQKMPKQRKPMKVPRKVAVNKHGIPVQQ